MNGLIINPFLILPLRRHIFLLQYRQQHRLDEFCSRVYIRLASMYPEQIAAGQRLRSIPHCCANACIMRCLPSVV